MAEPNTPGGSLNKHIAGAAVVAGLALTALTGCSPRQFANCTEMHTVYIGGVGKVGAVDLRSGGGVAKYTPKWDNALYDANSGSDADHDGIACEQ
ncbi:MAG: excalibur calcium-binding domain-containing protein [Acidimicrobiales bacterium]